MASWKHAILSGVIVLLLGSTARPAVIGFESIPNSPPAAGGSIPIGDQWRSTLGVRFELEGGGLPMLARVGEPLTAFKGPAGGDTPLPGHNLGSGFITDNQTVLGVPAVIVIRFDTPLSSLAGQLIDVDRNESFRIEAHDATGAVVHAVHVNEGPDGGVTNWSLTTPSEQICSVHFIYTGIKTGKVGFALDNLSGDGLGVVSRPDVPEPTAAGLLAAGALGLAVRRRRSA